MSNFPVFQGTALGTGFYPTRLSVLQSTWHMLDAWGWLRTKERLVAYWSTRGPALLRTDTRETKDYELPKKTFLIEKFHAQAQRRHTLIKVLRYPQVSSWLMEVFLYTSKTGRGVHCFKCPSLSKKIRPIKKRGNIAKSKENYNSWIIDPKETEICELPDKNSN